MKASTKQRYWIALSSMAVLCVLLDSCVILPMPLCDTLLRAAEAGLYRVHFSQKILDDATGNLVKQGRMTEARAARFQEMLKTHFPEAMVEVPEELVAVMTNRPLAKVVAGVLWSLKLGDHSLLFISFTYYLAG